jgi:hypothetical protein
MATGGSQFDRTAYLKPDGVNLSGTQERAAEDTPVEYFLLVVQEGAVARGRGRETSPSAWTGEAITQQGQPSLSAGPALAIGLAVVGTNEPRGFQTFSWSATIELT